MLPTIDIPLEVSLVDPMIRSSKSPPASVVTVVSINTDPPDVMRSYSLGEPPTDSVQNPILLSVSPADLAIKFIYLGYGFPVL